MSTNPRVSVVIPCFNLGRFLGETLGSVLAQTYRDFEIVVVDDGSTDDETRWHLETLDASMARVIRSEHRGLSAARNLGIRCSVGAFVCCVDADDRLEATWLERGVELLDSEKDLSFVSHWLEAFGDEKWEWKPGRCDLGMLLDFNVVNGAALVRREVLDAVGGYDESMRQGCEDWEFWIRVTESGYRGAIVPDVLYHYRRRPDSMSRAMDNTDAHLRLYADIIEKHPLVYQQYLLDLALRRERTFADLCQHIDGLEQEIAALRPAVEARRWELETADARLAWIEAHLAIARERDIASGRVAALENSCSWRLMEPFRRVYDWLSVLWR